MTELLRMSDAGFYCAAGDFHIDPWRAVARAVITHAHGDHARAGNGAYLAAAPGEPLLRARVGDDARIETMPYGQTRRVGEVDLSFHPAGHVLGSAQVRLRHGGRTLVVGGDYKLAPDPTCAAFEPVRADVFVTESTFGLPIYRWDPPQVTLHEVLAWWEANRAAGRASVLFAYALGKAQRLLLGLAQLAGTLPGPVYLHGAVARINAAYRVAGVPVPDVARVADVPPGTRFAQALVLAPPSARGSTWLRRFEPCSTAFASGWMALRGTRRRAALDRGFALSDHADWPALVGAIEAAGAREVWVTHGYREELARFLAERGYDARSVDTPFEGERGEAAEGERGEAAEGERGEAAEGDGATGQPGVDAPENGL